MLHTKSFMFCNAVLAFCVSQTCAKFIHFEAEDGLYTGSKMYRSEASGKATIHLAQSQSVTHTFTTGSPCLVTIHDVAYTNDGGLDVIKVYIDGFPVGSFNTISASNYGRNWNVIRNAGMIGENKEIDSGSHQLLFKAVNTDSYGVELDKSILNITCTAPIQLAHATPNSTNVTCTAPIQLAYATRNSTNTSCAEEDNVNIPIYYSGVESFKVTATLPKYYPSDTTMNNRNADFTNCKFASQNIWEIGANDNSHSEFSVLCTSDIYIIGEPISTFCHEINNMYNITKYTIYFTAKGISSGLVEASIGSVLTVKFTQVTGNLVLEVRCFGRDKKWLSLGNATFSSGELTKMWQVPDLTWSEGQNSNQIELQVTSGSSVNATGKFDYLKLDKRDESGESTPITVFNNGATIIEAITIDFWWLYPKGMIIKDLHNNQEWKNISYFRIYRKIPGTNNFAQLFVLYQDGNSRILPFPPNGIDWIPFGSSVIIGPTTSSSVRPYASIIRVNINARSLTMEIYYESGGKAVATLQYTAKSTTINVDDISYTTTSLIPFTTFRSMWVADGNADVDHIQTKNNYWHIQYGWQCIAGLSFQFLRSYVSTHNTLSPDILIVVKCKSAETCQTTKSPSSSKSTVSSWTLIMIPVFLWFIWLYTLVDWC